MSPIFPRLAGGRQVDGAIGSFGALERKIRSERVRHGQEQGKFTVLFDSGIRTGSDVIKAIAMGAPGVLCEHDASLLFENEGFAGVHDVRIDAQQ
jgi:lactate 2-monooxygenase